MASCLEGIGEIALAQGNPSWTVQLFAAAKAVRAANGYHTPLGIEQPFYDQTLSQARAKLGEQTFDVLWTEGQIITLDQVMNAEVKEDNPHSFSSSASVPVRASTPLHDLTRRELEVLHLLAQGLTNAQMAEQLGVSSL